MSKVRVTVGKGPRGGKVTIPSTARVSVQTANGRLVNLTGDRAKRYVRNGVGSHALYNGKAVTF